MILEKLSNISNKVVICFKNDKEYEVDRNSGRNYDSVTEFLDISFKSYSFTYKIMIQLQKIFFNIKNLKIYYKEEYE